MLKVTVGLALLLLIALIGYRRTFTRLRLPSGAQLVFLTGTEFILVGVALGDVMIGILDEQTIRSLTPLFSLGLGFVGLIFGIQLQLGRVLRFPGRYLAIAALQAAFTMSVVFGPCYLVLQRHFGGDDRSVLFAALVLAATAACTAQTALALIGAEFKLRGARLMELLRYISGIDAAFGLLVFGLAFCLIHTRPVLGSETAIALQWFALSLALGSAMGCVLHLLTRTRCSEEELLIFVIGMVVFSGGIALYVGLSPLFVNAVLGLVAANLPGSKERIFNLLVRLEKPFYVVFLVLAGAVWRPESRWALGLAALYLGLRLLGKLGGGALAASLVEKRIRPPLSLGLGLVSQGGIVVAMVMSYYQLSRAAPTGAVVTAVLIAVIANELASPSLARAVLHQGGEIER